MQLITSPWKTQQDYQTDIKKAEQTPPVVRLDKLIQPRPFQKDLVNNWDKYKRIMCVWPRRCLSGDTNIIMANGRPKLLKEIKAGDEILAWNGSEIVIDKVKEVWSTGIKKTKVVKGSLNPPMITSYDHLFANTCQNSGVLSWTKAEALGSKRLLLSYSGYNYGKINNPELAEFIGYMVCDGYVSGYQQPKFTNTNMEILRRVEELALQLFGYKAIWRVKGNGYDLGLSNGTKGGGTFINKVKQLFRDDGQDVSKAKRRLLSVLWDMDEESIGRFFAAVISSDGNIFTHQERKFRDDERNRDITIKATTEITINCGLSSLCAWDMYYLLRKMGIIPHIPYLEHGANWKVKIGKSHSIRQLLSYGPVYGKTSAQDKALSSLNSNTESLPLWNSCFRTHFKSSEGEEVETYDLETEKNHNFFANGYLVHNSGKDIACLSMCLRDCLRYPGFLAFYMLPTTTQAKRVVWNGVTNDGQRLLGLFPPEFVESMNASEMRISFTNGSQLLLCGSDNYNCFDDKTEILTENGWKLFKDLVRNERVATLKSGYLVYDLPIDYLEKDFNGEMYRGLHSGIDFLVTPNHRFWVRSGKGFYKFKTIDELSLSGDSIPSTCKWVGEDKEYFEFPVISSSWITGKGRRCEKTWNKRLKMEDFVALLGIFLAEGNTYKDPKTYRVTISQKKEHTRKEIDELLKRCGIHFIINGVNFCFEDKQLYEYFSQFGLQKDRFIPKEIKNLSPKYLKVLFDWLIKGDGSITKAYTAYYSCSKKLIDDVQEIAIKLGFSGNIRLRVPVGTKIWFKRDNRYIQSKQDLWEFALRKSKFKRFSSSKKKYITKETYSGKVYCVEVPSGIIKVRRNGKEIWSGNSLLGTNAKLMIFSEFAVAEETSWNYLKPILLGNGGRAVFISTPRGHTHFWEMWKVATKLPEDWYVSHLNVEQTGHIPLELIQKEIDSGETSLDLARQEFWCSWDLGVEGAFFTRIMDGLRLRGQITQVMYDPGLPVHLSFDLGINDPTCIIFFQVKANAVYLIDYFQASDQCLEDIAKLLREKGYNYGSMFVPHDARNREQGTSGGVSRIESAARLGMRWSVLPGLPFEDGIEATRASMPRWWIDETRCAKLISCLENYRREYNEDLKAYSSHPLHNWACHGADAARYLAIALPRTNKSTTAEELDRRYYETVYGQSSQLPAIFRNDTPKGIF